LIIPITTLTILITAFVIFAEALIALIATLTIPIAAFVIPITTNIPILLKKNILVVTNSAIALTAIALSPQNY